MSLSKYPKKFDLYEVKRDAAFDGDPNGDYVMAEDVNELQDAILAIEKTLGLNPSGDKLTVGERITLLEGATSLRVPSFLLYAGVPADINGATSTEEAVNEFLKFEHIALEGGPEDPNHSSHTLTKAIIEGVKKNRSVVFYGVIDCGTLSLNQSIAEINMKAQNWKDLGVSGIYCKNFGFEHGVSRTRQNQVLDSIHALEMNAVLSGEKPEELFSDAHHDKMNPNWAAPHIQSGDIYHYEMFMINTGAVEVYSPMSKTKTEMEKLYEYRKELGIKIFGTPLIDSSINKEQGQRFYDYAHIAALLFSLDGFHPTVEAYGQGTSKVRVFDWVPLAGSWYSISPTIEEKSSSFTRSTSFGELQINEAEKTYQCDGLYIPLNLLKFAANSLEGDYVKEGSIKDSKIESYSGQRLIEAINKDTGSVTINVSKIGDFNYDNLQGSISSSALRAHIIEAINANIGFAKIEGAMIGNLNADQITAGTINAELLRASVIDAINARIGEAVIDQAKIGDLHASKIKAGDIEAERLKAAVVEAINLSAKQGDIENLNAENITAGNIAADRIQTNVINAINAYAETLQAGEAVIDTAVIGKLTATHMQGEVINAINAAIDSAKINSAKIGELEVNNMKAAVINAINANIGSAVIDQGVIGDLSATKITAGDIDADRIKATVFEAIEANIKNAKIDQAHIGDLSAEKIRTGTLDAERIASSVVEALDIYAQNMTAGSASINTAVIGALESRHLKSAVIEAINLSAENASISAAKIGELDVRNIKASVIAAVNASIESAVIDQAKIGDLNASKIKAGDIHVDRLKASVISAVNGSFESITIDSGRIGSLAVDNLKAATISAINASIESATINAARIGSLDVTNLKANVVEAINASIASATIDAAKIKALTADHIKAVVLEAINLKSTNATIDNAVVGQLSVENMKGKVVEAVNSYTGSAVIGEARIGALSADKITTGNIHADRIATNVIAALDANIGKATINKAVIPQLDAGQIKAEVIKAINLSTETAKIDAAQIGKLDVENLKAAVIQAINISTETASINSAKIGTLSADKMRTNILDAINFWAGTATINEALIGSLNATKINAGDIHADRMRTNVISAVNADLTNATIDAAQIGSLKAGNIKAEVIEAINASIETAKINAAQIGSLKAANIKAEIIEAINASIESAKIKEAAIADLNASKITAGNITAERLTANVVTAINSVSQTAQIDTAKIKDLNATKITAGDIQADRMKTNIITAVNAYVAGMTVGSAKIDSAAIGVLAADHMQAKVISAINASIDTIGGKLAVIDQAKIGDLNASKITAGDIATARLSANVVDAVNLKAGVVTAGSAKIDAAAIGTLTANHIKTVVFEAINGRIGTAVIDSAKIQDLDATKITTGTLNADRIKSSVITAINGTFEAAVIGSAKIADLDASKIKTGSFETDRMKANVIDAINIRAGVVSANAAKLDSAAIGTLTADHIKAVVIDAVNGRIGSATIDAAKIGVLEAGNIKANSIATSHIATQGLDASVIKTGFLDAGRIRAESIDSGHIKSGSIETYHMTAGSIDGSIIKGDTIHGSKIIAGTLSASNLTAGSITSVEIAAKTIQTRNLAAGAVDASVLRAGTITAEHISTVGLDANQIEVFGSDGQVLIGDGYLKVDGLDAGVIQSDNLIGNGLFLTASSAFGHLRDNPSGEAILGSQSKLEGAHQLWRIDTTTGEKLAIDTGGTKPVDVAIDAKYEYLYVTLQGEDQIAQIQVSQGTQAARTGATLMTGKGPGRILFTGDKLMDHKHFFILNTDPKDVNIPDSLTIIDGPPTSINQDLYVHHMIPLGNTPYDVAVSMVMNHTDLMPSLENPHPGHEMYVYITQASQGDIAVIDASHVNSTNWKVIRTIPIAAHMLDNYHGGLDGRFGLGAAVGGDASSQYSDKPTLIMHNHGHGGYGTSDGSIRTYTPHGIALSKDAKHIYVADYANGHLLVIDVDGKAPYNPLTGTRMTGNLGEMGVPFPGGGAGGGDTGDGGDHGGHVHAMAVEEEELFTVQAGGHNHGGGTNGPIDTPGFSGVIAQEQQTTKYVRYRIPVGDSPDRIEVVDGKIFVTLEGSGAVAVIDEAAILTEIEADRAYYGPGWNEFVPMRSLPSFTVRQIEVGAKPSNIDLSPDKKLLYVTVNGQNQIAKIDIATEKVLARFNTGPNPKGIKVSPDGAHIYVVNHGGSGNLSFVYPSGQYIGDAYLGLEGGVEYQGAEHWMPNRSNWAYDQEDNNKVQSATTIEFHVNEPFLNEGGFTRMSSYGVDPQWATIEQDVFNVVNYSNGNNVAFSTGEQLKQDASLVRFWPKNEWLRDYQVKNITIFAKNDEFLRRDAVDDRVFYPTKKWIEDPERPVILVGMSGDFVEISENEYNIVYGQDAKIVFTEAIAGDKQVYSSSYYYSEVADPTKYVVYFEGETETSTNGTTYGDSHITFVAGYLPQGCAVKADYTYKHNRWFKSHNGSVLIATENSSSENFYVQFEVDEFVPKFITVDNQQTKPFTYWPIEVPAVTSANYTGLEYSAMTKRSTGAKVTSSVAPTSGNLASIVDDKEPMSTEEEMHMHSMDFEAMHAYGETVVFPAGLQQVTIDLEKTYMVTDIHISHCFHENRMYRKTKTEVSQDGIHWTTIYDSAVSGEYMECEYNAGHGMTHYGKHFAITPQPVRYVRDWSNGYTEWAKTGTDVANWTQMTKVGDFTANHWTDIKVFADWEFEKEFSKNYTAEMLNTNPQNPKVTFQKGTVTVVGGNKATNIGGDNEQDVTRIVNDNLTSQNEFTAGNGAATVTIDLGAVKKVDTIRVFRHYADGRTHKGVKTEVSANGTTWTTVYNSATAGEYAEKPGGKILSLGGVKDVRYIRDTAQSWSATLKTGTVLTGNDIRWVGIHAYLDYNASYPYVYQDGAELEGQNLATNGQGVTTTDISGAYAAIDIPIDYTSWWYMTYLVGPQFGQLDVEMPTVMGGSHSLFEDGPYLNKVAHRHIMSWPSSKNVKEDASQNIKAGLHRAVVRQKSGKVSLDRFRFEDYQYLYMNSTEIPKGSATNFIRHKIEPDVAKWYIGRGNQSTEGAYDTPRVNLDTGKPDASVAIKYRFRIKTRLNPKGLREERGVAYATSAIFETGRLSSHWRMSQAQDSFPGNRIQRWDGNQPHKTGIQHDHIANGAVRGSKLMAHAVMDHHISPYARIEESKLNLKYPTHRHGRWENITLPDGVTQVSAFIDNKEIIDSIIGFENCNCHGEPGPCTCPTTCMCSDKGSSFTMARGDHKHDHRYVKLNGDNILVGNFSLTGNITVSGLVDGVDISLLKSDFDVHAADATAHLSVAEHTKLTGIATGATKVEASTNGKIKINAVDTTVYTHPTGDGNLHVPANGTTNNNKVLKAGSAAGTLSWADVSWSDVVSKPATFTPPIATSTVLGGVKVGSGINVDASGVISWSHAAGDGNLHVPATGTGNNAKVLKAGATAGSISWAQVQFSEVGGTITFAQHGTLVGGNLHADATGTTAGFMSAADKTKLDGIAVNANNYIHPSTHSLSMMTETATQKIMTDVERTKLSGIEESANNYIHPATHAASMIEQDANNRFMTDTERTKLAGISAGANNYSHPAGDGSLHVPATGTGNNGKFLKAGAIAGSLSWAQAGFADLSGGITDGQHGNRSGGALHTAVTTSTNGFMISTDKAKLDGIQDNAINQTSADSRYLKLSGGALGGDLSITPDNTGLTLFGGARVYKKSGSGLKLQPHVDSIGVAITNTVGTDIFVVKTDGGGMTYNGSTLWHAGNFNPTSKADVSHAHTVANITDLSTNYYNKTEINNQLATKGDVKSTAATTFSETGTFAKTGLALKIQPSAAVAGGTVLFQLNTNTGNTLVTMGTNTAGTSAKVVINGDLEVTGATVQKSTQDIQGDMNVTGNLNATGDVVLGNAASDQTTIRGDLRLEGELMPIGKYLEAARYPLFGIADDFQVEVDSLTFEEVISNMATFNKNGASCLPQVNPGAQRFYRLLVIYNSSGTEDSVLRIVEHGTANEVFSSVLPATNTTDMRRSWMSNHFSTEFLGNTTIQVKKNVSGMIEIHHIELVAYDYYA